MRTVDQILAAFPAGSVTTLPAADVAVLVAEVERLRSAIADGGFRVGPDLLGRSTLWCIECARDSGLHWDCSKSRP